MGRTKQAGDNRAGVKTVRAVIIDDQLVFRMGLRMYLAEAMREIEWAGEAESIQAGLSLVERARPELVLLDAFLGDGSIDRVMADLRQRSPESRIVVLANYPDARSLALAASAGACGYMLKTLPPARMVAALQEVLGGVTWIQPELMQELYAQVAQGPQVAAAAAAGETVAADGVDLTPRQLEVLRLVAEGLRNSEIAERLTISEQTVKTHVAHLLEKLGVTSRLQAARYAISKKLVDA